MTAEATPIDLDHDASYGALAAAPTDGTAFDEHPQQGAALANTTRKYLPVLGGLVQVSIFDGAHNIRNAFAHVVSVSPAVDGEDYPTITVVYPKQPVEDNVRNLSGPDWSKAFERQTGVPHSTSNAVADRTSSIAYLVLGEAADLNDLFDAPEGSPAALQADGQKRQLSPKPTKDSPQMAYAAQAGSIPTPTVHSPLVNDLYTPTAAEIADREANYGALQTNEEIQTKAAHEAAYQASLAAQQDPALTNIIPPELVSDQAPPPLTEVIPEATKLPAYDLATGSLGTGIAPVEFETKHYADGSSATGVAPLPDVSPEEALAVAGHPDEPK